MRKRQSRCLFTTSWDDGHPHDLRVAELLAACNLPGTFYIPRSGPGPVMHESEIRMLSESFEIGGHTLDHVSMDRLSDVAAVAQLSGSRDWLEQTCGKPCLSFCFPGGKFRTRQLPLVRQAGFRVARTVELLSTAFPHRIEGLALLPTTIQVFPHRPWAYARNILKRCTMSSANWPRRTLFSGNWAALAADVFFRTLERGGVFHLWGHSWEIEERRQWKNLEQFLRMVSSCREKWQSTTNGELYELSSHPVLAESAVPAALPERAK